MKGFIFGFQRFVWCPKWTPASNNSGTNSVVSAIKEIPERELLERDAKHATAPANAQPEIRRSATKHNIGAGDLLREWLLVFDARSGSQQRKRR
jgi:hypothetical protein